MNAQNTLIHKLCLLERQLLKTVGRELLGKRWGGKGGGVVSPYSTE